MGETLGCYKRGRIWVLARETYEYHTRGEECGVILRDQWVPSRLEEYGVSPVEACVNC